MKYSFFNIFTNLLLINPYCTAFSHVSPSFINEAKATVDTRRKNLILRFGPFYFNHTIHNSTSSYRMQVIGKKQTTIEVLVRTPSPLSCRERSLSKWYGDCGKEEMN
jgi:hypothetical protein